MSVNRLAQCQGKCGRTVATQRSKLGSICFIEQAAKSGARSAGNAKAKGAPGNAGNAKGNPGNAGNTKRGKIKKCAGKRSGLKRSARYALVVKKKWLDQILSGDKDWEIRGGKTKRRGWVHLAESQAGGRIVGRARLVDCVSVSRQSFMEHVDRHCVTSLTMVPYTRIFAWVFKDAQRFEKPFTYKHKVGAVIWVKIAGL